MVFIRSFLEPKYIVYIINYVNKYITCLDETLTVEPLIGQPICYAIDAHPHLSELDLTDLPGDGSELAISV